VGELGPAVEVGNSPAESTPSTGPFSVPLFASIDAKVVGVMNGGFGA
jgi:hypothetical protein